MVSLGRASRPLHYWDNGRLARWRRHTSVLMSSCAPLAYEFFWKQLEQLVKTTSSFSPRNSCALEPAGVLPSAKEVVFVSCHGCFHLAKPILICIPVRSAGGGLSRIDDLVVLVEIAICLCLFGICRANPAAELLP